MHIFFNPCAPIKLFFSSCHSTSCSFFLFLYSGLFPCCRFVPLQAMLLVFFSHSLHIMVSSLSASAFTFCFWVPVFQSLDPLSTLGGRNRDVFRFYRTASGTFPCSPPFGLVLFPLILAISARCFPPPISSP